MRLSTLWCLGLKLVGLALVALTMTAWSAVVSTGAVGVWAGPGEGGYAIVINAANPYSADITTMKVVVKQLYLKQRRTWPTNVAARPFGRPAGSAEETALLAHVLGLSGVELAQHCLSMKQRTGQTCPTKVSYDRMVLKLVAKYKGAFAIVTTETAASAGADVVTLFTLPE